jgi:hypothetical protein
MRGSIFTVVAVGVGAALTPAILDIDVSGDATGDTVLGLLGSVEIVVALAFVVAAFGLLLAFFTDSGF